MSMDWGSPENFKWLWLLPAVLGLFIFSDWRRSLSLRCFGETPLVRRLTLSLNPALRWAKRILILFAMLMTLLALCQPHFSKKEIEVERKGVDVMILVDVSQSMLAKDLAPTRLDKAKLELETLVEKLKQDRIGIVAFAGDAFIQCPLTTDHNAVKLFLSSVSPNLVPAPGTMIGRAIQVGMRAFMDADKGFKTMIILTDGEDQGSDPMNQAKAAVQAGISIFTIGIGTPAGSTLPAEPGQGGQPAGQAGTLKKDLRGNIILSKLDEGLLRKIAAETGGVYYRASRGEIEIEDLTHRIRQMTQKGLKKSRSVEYEENYQFFLLLAILALFLEIILTEKRKTPEGPILKTLVLVLLSLPLLGFDFYSKLKNEQGNRYYQKGQLSKARSQYEAALKGAPRTREIAFNLGNAYYKEGLFKESMDSYKKAAESKNSPILESHAFYNIGNALYREEDLEKAGEFYKQALRIDPSDADAKVNLELTNKALEKKQQEPKKDKKQDQKQKQDQQQKKEGQSGQDQKDQNKGQEQKEDRSGPKPKDQKESQDQTQKSGAQKNEEEKKDEGASGSDQGDKPGERPNEGVGTKGGGEEKSEELKPKTEAQMRAEQMLSALESDEKQTLKMQGSRNGPVQRGGRIIRDKDW